MHYSRINSDLSDSEASLIDYCLSMHMIFGKFSKNRLQFGVVSLNRVAGVNTKLVKHHAVNRIHYTL